MSFSIRKCPGSLFSHLSEHWQRSVQEIVVTQHLHRPVVQLVFKHPHFTRLKIVSGEILPSYGIPT